MDFYTKGASDTQEVSEKESAFELHIKSGKKIKVCISQALKTLKTSKDKVMISGSGPTVTKAITTAEIVKRKIKGLHQQNNLYYTKTEDLWEPKQEGLDQLKVTRNVPCISIILSYKPLDQQTPGYQAPGIHLPLVQFREEDIALADECLEGKSELQQLQHTDSKKQGTKRTRTQSHGKHQQYKKEKTRSEQERATPEKNTEGKCSTNKKDSRKQHGRQKQSKTQNQEKDKT